MRLKIALAELAKYDAAVTLYVANFSGDMVGEYVAVHIATAVVVGFSSHPCMSLTSETIYLGLIAYNVLSQHVPEIVCDLMSLRFEVMHGLPVRTHLRELFTMQAMMSRLAVTSVAIAVMVMSMSI